MDSITTDIMVSDDRHSFPLSIKIRRVSADAYNYDEAVIDFGYGASYYLEDLFSTDPMKGLQFKNEEDNLCLDISGRNFFGSPVNAKVKDILEIPEVEQYLTYLDMISKMDTEVQPLEKTEHVKPVDQFLLVLDDNSTENDVLLNIGDISAFVYSNEMEIWNLQMKSGTYLSLKISPSTYGKYLERIKDFLIKRNDDSFYYCEHHLFLIIIKTLAVVKFKNSKLYLHLKNGKYLITDSTLKSYQIMLPELDRKLKGLIK